MEKAKILPYLIIILILIGGGVGAYFYLQKDAENIQTLGWYEASLELQSGTYFKVGDYQIDGATSYYKNGNDEFYRVISAAAQTVIDVCTTNGMDYTLAVYKGAEYEDNAKNLFIANSENRDFLSTYFAAENYTLTKGNTKHIYTALEGSFGDEEIIVEITRAGLVMKRSEEIFFEIKLSGYVIAHSVKENAEYVGARVQATAYLQEIFNPEDEIETIFEEFDVDSDFQLNHFDEYIEIQNLVAAALAYIDGSASPNAVARSKAEIESELKQLRDDIEAIVNRLE